MADLNQFLKSLGIARPQYENSPEDPLATDDAPMFKVPVEEDEPALEESDMAPAKPGPLASQADVAKMAQFPRSPAEERLNSEMKAAQTASAELPSLDLTEEKPQQEPSKLSRYQELVKNYNDRNANLGMLAGANQIAQGFALGAGGKIGAGTDQIQMLQGMNQDPLKQLQGEDAATMMDPSSDISKYYREQAYTMLKKLNPGKDYSGTLDKMSASQLQKLPGMKNIGAQPQMQWVATDRVDKQGNPIRFNRATGEYSKADGTIIQPGETIVRDIARRDPLTGQYGYVSAGQGMEVVPTNYNAVTKPGEAKAGEAPKPVTYEEFNKIAPEQTKKFDKIRDDFTKDMKDSRDVATATTNLAHKLTPGKNGDIDSGLLGGIQTQAAKMAGQKGVLTDQDLVKFAGAGGVSAQLQRIIDGSMFGNMSKEDIKFFNRFAQLMNQSLEEDIQNRSQIYVHQGRQIVGTLIPRTTNEDVAEMLGVNKVAPAVQNKEKITSNSKPGEVRRKTADGKIAIFDEKTKKFLRYEE